MKSTGPYHGIFVRISDTIQQVVNGESVLRLKPVPDSENLARTAKHSSLRRNLVMLYLPGYRNSSRVRGERELSASWSLGLRSHSRLRNLAAVGKWQMYLCNWCTCFSTSRNSYLPFVLLNVSIELNFSNYVASLVRYPLILPVVCQASLPTLYNPLGVVSSKVIKNKIKT